MTRWGSVCMGAFFLSCGIFSVRDPHYPVGLPQDPLRLADITRGTSMEFTRTQRSDIITPATIYHQEPFNPESGDRLADRLNDIEQNHTGVYVRWTRDTLEQRGDDPRGTVYRMYFVWLDGDSTRGEDFHGRSIFRLGRREELNTWVITRWEDRPLDRAGNPYIGDQKSFFHPDFDVRMIP